MSSGVRQTRDGILYLKEPSSASWKKCLFVLEGRILKWSEKSEEGSSATGTTGELDLTTEFCLHKESEVPTYRKMTFDIELVKPTGNDIYVFSAQNETEKEDWIYLFSELLNNQDQSLPSSSSDDKETVPVVSNTSEVTPTSSTTTIESTTSSPIRLGRSSLFLVVPGAPPPPDEATLVVEDSTHEVRSGTLEKLVECVWNSPYASLQYITDFLLSYRAFATPIQVLQYLIDRYGKLKDTDDITAQFKKASRLRICNFLKKWVSESQKDFEGDSEFIGVYINFVDALISVSDPKLAPALKQKMLQLGTTAEKRDGKVNIFSQEAPQVDLPKGITDPKMLPSSSFSVLDISALELARQLTILEYTSYKAIQPHEFFNNAWNSSEKEKLSPNIIKISNSFNNISRWVADVITKEKNLKLRIKKFKRFIKLALECLKLNNFNAVFEITGGLQNSAVHRLKKTQEALPDNIKKSYEELLHLTHPNKSWKNYRETLHTINPPCVPFIGIYQTDLTFISEGNQVKVNGLINFRKCRLLASVIKEIQQYQKMPYNLTLVVAIQQFLQDAQNLSVSDNELFEASLIAEPRT